jgi:DNA-binding transcriptional ArsR family regulator
LRKDLLIIRDPEVAKLFADDTRRQILHILRHHEHSTTELAKALEKNHSSIIHHLNLLRKAGLIEETKIEKVRNMVVSYYRSTARRFMVTYSLSEALNQEGEDIPWQEAMIQDSLEGLAHYGVVMPDDSEDEVRKLMNTYFIRNQKAFEETIEHRNETEGHGVYHNHRVESLLKHVKLSMDDEYAKAVKGLNDILRLKTVARGEKENE